jgi:hypothetical protein
MKIANVLFVSFAVAACTGGGGSTGTTSGTTPASQEPAGSAGQEDAYCDAQKSHETCNGGTSTSACREDAKCIYGRLMSRTAANAYFACYSAPSCKSDDNCADEAGKAAGGAAADAWVSDCTAKATSCGPEGEGIDELCTPTLYAYPNVIDAAKACLAKACSELEACFDAALKLISDCK